MLSTAAIPVSTPAAVSAASPAPGAAAAKVRVGWIDAARGMGIVLVVAGHALGGLIDSPLARGAPGLRAPFLAIYTFHMPLFLLLSGLMVPARLTRGPAPFLRRVLPELAWPYFLWSAAQFTVIFALGALVNRPAANYWPTLLALPWRPLSQFWFLYVLAVMHGLAALVLPRAGAAALLVLGLAAKLASAALVLPAPVSQLAHHLIWYALGAALAGMEPQRLSRVLLGLGGLALAMVAAVAPVAGASPPPLATSSQLAGHAWGLWAAPAALGGMAALVALAAFPALAGSRALCWLGRHSMAVFVLHVLFVAGARIVLVRMGLITQPWVLLAVMVPLGLAGPLLAERALRPLGLRRWLGF